MLFHLWNLIFHYNLRRFDGMLHNILFQVVTTFLSVGCVVITVSTEFYGKSTFLDDLDYFDNHIEIPVSKRKLLLWFLLVIERLEITVLVTIEILTCIDLHGVTELKTFFGSFIELIMFGTTRILIFWMLDELCLRFKILKLSKLFQR